MAVLFTLDASVLVASCRPSESWWVRSRELLQLLQRSGAVLIEPAIFPVEIAAALARIGVEPAAVEEYAEGIMTAPHISLLPVDGRMARQASRVAVEHRLRGADALYVTVAAQYGAVLVTLDAEQLRRAPPAVRACRPDAAAASLR